MSDFCTVPVKNWAIHSSAEFRKSVGSSTPLLSTGQHPWKDCSKEFEDYLDNLAKLPLYGGCMKDARAKDMTKVEDRLSLRKLGAREPVLFDVESFVEQDEGEVEILEIVG